MVAWALSSDLRNSKDVPCYRTSKTRGTMRDRYGVSRGNRLVSGVLTVSAIDDDWSLLSKHFQGETVQDSYNDDALVIQMPDRM